MSDVAIGWKIVLFCLAVICGLSFFIGFYGVYNVYTGLNTVHNSSIDGIKFFKSVKENVDAVDFSFGPKISRLLQNLKEDIDSLGIVPSLFTKIIDIMDSMISFASEANDDIIRANIPFINLSRIDIEWIPEDIETYGNLSCGCALILVLILTGLGLAFTFAAFNSYLLGILIILALIGFILSAILMSVSLSGTIFVSDFCLDVKPFIKQELGEEILYQFIVECPLEDKPLLKVLKSAEKVVINLRESYNKVFSILKKLFETYCTVTKGAVNVGLSLFKNINKSIPVFDIPNNMNITCPSNIKEKVVNTLEGINNELDSYTNLINTLMSIADCRRIDKDLYDGLNAICGEINPGVVYLLFYSILILICIIIIIFCATFVLIRSSTQSESQTKDIPKVKQKK